MVETCILVFGRAFIFGKYLETYLVPINYIRANGCFVGDVPKHFTKGRSLHRKYVPEEDLTIPCYTRGMMSYIPIRL